MTHVAQEIGSQPGCWERAAELAEAAAVRLPPPAERVAAVGCGTSWFVAQSYAVLRRGAGAERRAAGVSALRTGRA